nr:hypothetical protein [Tanacetum cinerariifolium]
MNVAQPKMTSFAKTTHSNVKRSFQRKSAVKNQPRVLRVSTVTEKIPTVDSKFPTAKSTLTADLRDKRKVVKASARGIWRPKQNTSEQGPNYNYVSMTFKKYQYIDTQGRLKHMTGNTSYLSEYEPYDGGYVSFGHGGGRITCKGKDFKLNDDTNVFLRTPRQHNMYSIVLNNIVPHKNLTYLVAKASVDERKQHKASCKTKLVNFVSKPLHTLHMDLFRPTCVSSLNHKWYCLAVTDDISRFTWTFFLRTKDVTSSILRNFKIKIENLKDLKVKIIRCDNGGEFKNQEMNKFCTKKGIRKEFSNARTPQQNGVAERRNRTLIEAARTMLADAKLPITFWAEAVNTACYVQNKVLVNKSQNKTPYELFNSRIPAIGFIRPFRCHVMIFNTLDHLGKFDAKGDDGYFVGNSDAQDDSQKEQDCNTDVPERSEISNPTATSKVPSSDQVEHVVSLTVEYEILTVSSPVPTTSPDVSLENSCGPRLISKGVFITLNEVEANLSNMETIIPVSPTPTFRIHKDHPKSQIIDPVDTLVQTKNKSKDMEEQSFIATIHQKTNPDLLQFCLFSCFLSEEEPKKIFDALKDPSWVEAMQEELL